MTELVSNSSPADITRPETSSVTWLLRGAGALYISTIISFAGRLLFAILIARLAGAEALGIFTLGFVALQVLAIFALFGIEVAIMHYASPAYHARDTHSLGRIFWAGVLTPLCLAVILAVGYWLLIPYYPLAAAGPVESMLALQLFALALPAQILISVLGAFALAHNNYLVRVFAERIVPALAQCAVLLLLVNVMAPFPAVTMSFVLSVMLGAGLAVVFTWRLYPRGAHVSELWGQTRRLYRYGYMQGLARLVGYSLMNANLFLLGVLADPFQVGVYAAASRLTLIGLMFLEAFGQMFSPIAASQLDKLKFKQEFQWTTKWIFMTSAPLFILLAVFAPVWMGLMGQAFVASSAVLAILALAQMMSMLTGASGVAQAVRGRPWLGFVNNVLGWGTSAVLTAVWAAEYGALGAAVAYLAAIVVFELLETIECFVFFGFAPFGVTMMRPLLASGALGVAAWLLYNAFSLNVYTASVISGILLAGYAGVLWYYGLETQDKAAVHSIAMQLPIRSLFAGRKYRV